MRRLGTVNRSRRTIHRARGRASYDSLDATDVRDALRGFASIRVRRRRGPVAGPRGRRQHGHLQRRSALLLRPLPYRSRPASSSCGTGRPASGSREDWFSTAQYFDIKNSESGLEQVAIVYGANENLTGDGEPSGSPRSASRPTLHDARRAAGRRTALHRRRGPADAVERGRPRLRHVGPALRQRSERRRPAARVERTPVSRSSACCPRPSRCRTRSCRPSATPPTPTS
jgi:hypothetical protein